MKFIKWLFISVTVLVLVLGVGIAALVYLVDWNDFKDTIQNQVKKQTGRDLEIAGDLSPSVFPWAGISIGEISLANAEGYGDTPFARIGSADVKVKLLPLIKKEVNVRTVELIGLQVDLQRAADGTTNWDDLINSTTTTTSTDEGSTGEEVTTEVEGSSATIAALAVGGIQIRDANVSWTDVQSGTDARLSGFNLSTGAIELAKPFDLATDFTVESNSMDLNADIKGGANLMIDLDNQRYTVNGFTLDTAAKGGAFPGGELLAKVGADVEALLGENQIIVQNVSLGALGLELDGNVNITNLDTTPNIVGQFASNEFVPRELFTTLGIEAPVTADSTVLNKASLSLGLQATPESAALNDLKIVLDDTTFSGKASVPSLAGAVPPLRFDFAVDAIDLDRYLPPASDAEAADDTTSDTDAGGDAGGDAPIELPVDMLKQLDIDGVFRVGNVKVSNLTTRDIVVPVKAKNGKVGVENLTASLYEGKLDTSAGLDVTGNTPKYSVNMALDGIQADPLLADLTQKKSFLSGAGRFATNITTSGNTVNGLTAALNGGFETAFTDGSVNGINLGYQIRRAKAAFSGQKLSEDAATVKTDFSSLAVSGQFNNGVMTSSDLDLRSPLLRVGGAGTVDLPGEQVDYTLTTLVTGTAQGQGGDDLAALKGVKIDIPIRGSFAELAANFAGVVFQGMKDNITGNLRNQAKAIADQKAAELKAKAQAEADKAKAKAQAELDKAKEQAEAQLKAKQDEVKDQLKDKAKDKLKGLFGN